MQNAQNKIILSSKNLLHNYEYLSSINKSVTVAPVLKSNAYGYGLLEIATILDSQNAPFFCVNSLSEAYDLWKNNINTPILIMGYVDPEDLKQETYPFSYAAYNYSQLSAINTYQKGAEIHLFIDTGMHREGFRVEKLEKLLQSLADFKDVTVIGVMSHFAEGDKADSLLTKKQLENFTKAREIIKSSGITPKWEHIGASTGILTLAQIEHVDVGNLARVGKALYGIDPSGNNQKLKPIAKLISKIVQVKTIHKGDTVGYDATYTADKETTIAVLPIGYYDGVDRRLSNKGFVMIRGVLCPIIGRVSMNITAIDVSDVSDPKVGDEVIVFSKNSEDSNSIENAAKLCDTIPYDIAVRFPTSIPRIISAS